MAAEHYKLVPGDSGAGVCVSPAEQAATPWGSRSIAGDKRCVLLGYPFWWRFSVCCWMPVGNMLLEGCQSALLHCQVLWARNVMDRPRRPLRVDAGGSSRKQEAPFISGIRDQTSRGASESGVGGVTPHPLPLLPSRRWSTPKPLMEGQRCTEGKPVEPVYDVRDT